jgi:VanZ family protein
VSSPPATPPLRIALAWLPALLYMALIWALSSTELPELPLTRFPMRDKLIHTIEYAALALFVAHAAVRTWPDRTRARLAAVAILIAGAWGVLDEIHQAFVPGRSSEIADVLADVLGASVGATARLVLSAVRARAATPAAGVASSSSSSSS